MMISPVVETHKEITSSLVFKVCLIYPSKSAMITFLDDNPMMMCSFTSTAHKSNEPKLIYFLMSPESGSIISAFVLFLIRTILFDSPKIVVTELFIYLSVFEFRMPLLSILVTLTSSYSS